MVSKLVLEGGKQKTVSKRQKRAPFLLVEVAVCADAGLGGQQTNSTPEKTSIPHGSSMAKLFSFMPRSEQAEPAVAFQAS